VHDLTRLRTADRAEAETFFAEVDPVQMVAAVADTGDDELLELVGRPEVRGAAVTGILRRLGEFAVPERLEQVHGVVRVDLQRRAELLEQHALRFGGGTIEMVDPATPADVVLATSVLRFVRLVSGERNAGLEYLAGKLRIEGDADLALAVGGIFKVPGRDDVAVDPSALDPVDVATVLKGVSTAHLSEVMASGFRPVVLDEIFRRLPDFLDERRARRLRLVVGFRLTGRDDGEVDRYVVEVDHGKAAVTEGDPGGHRDATITCTGHDFLRLATGHLNPVMGVMKGVLKVKGDRAKALLLSSVLDIPTSR